MVDVTKGHTMSSLRPILPVHSNDDLLTELARVVADYEETVCDICGLQVMGHGPESIWLGYVGHAYMAVPATADVVQRAGELTLIAYRKRCAKNLCGAYCQTTHTN